MRDAECTVLWALASTDYFSSPDGRAELGLIGRLARTLEIELAVDDMVPDAVASLREYCRPLAVRLHVGRGEWSPRAADPINRDLPALLAGRRWDAIECRGWANAGVNAAVLAGAGAGDAAVVYTPHDPPVRTRPMSPAQRAAAEATHRALLGRASLVCCDSVAQQRRLQELVPESACVTLPVGVDFEALPPGGRERELVALLVVEPDDKGARLERLRAVLAGARRVLPTLRLLTVSRGASEAADRDLSAFAETLGPVGDRELRRRYACAAAVVFPYAHEAAGTVIAEALASGTPVVISDGPDLRSRYAHLRSACFVEFDNPEEAGERLARTITSRTHIAALVDRDRLAGEYGLGACAARRERLLRELVS